MQKILLFDAFGFTTGISNVMVKPNNVQKGIYTLSGQRLAQAPARGIYIENGIKRIAQ